jgi:ectoine hydroxylase-related dioxygenase (phytanoyl-CoA dioxygenase family)
MSMVSALHERFVDDGYCVVPRLFSTSAIEEARAGVDAILMGRYDTGSPPRRRETQLEHASNRLVKIAEPQLASVGIAKLLHEPVFGQTAAAVMQARFVQVWAVDIFHKLPGGVEGGAVGWHQDAQYSHYWIGDTTTAWIALSDTDPVAGAMRYVVGSHRWGRVSGGDLYDAKLDSTRRTVHASALAEWREVIAAVDSGSVIFHHSEMVHASGPNCGAGPRTALAVRLRSEAAHPPDPLPHQLAHLADPSSAPVIFNSSS